jgi:hypothetical protein
MNDSTCHRLDDYLAGDLAVHERQAFEEHLPQCSTCAEEVRLQGEIDRLLAAAQPFAPPELQRNVAASLRRRQVRRVARLAVAAAVLFGCAAAGWRIWIADRGEPIEPTWAHRDDSSTPGSEAPWRPAQQSDQAATEPPPQIADTEPPSPRIRVDAGGSAIVVSQPSADPTVHIFWLYPTVSLSMNPAGDSADPAQPQRNPL